MTEFPGGPGDIAKQQTSTPLLRGWRKVTRRGGIHTISVVALSLPEFAFGYALGSQCFYK